jgi:hypothetical protein
MAEARTSETFAGYWRIVEMEVWGKDYLDLVVPAFIEFDREQMGQFQFGTGRGWLDCRFDERQGAQIVDFSWEGENDNDPGCGRGWAALRGDRLEGRLYIHRGDDSAFTASRAERAATLRRRGQLSVARHPISASRRRPPGGRRT